MGSTNINIQISLANQGTSHNHFSSLWKCLFRPSFLLHPPLLFYFLLWGCLAVLAGKSLHERVMMVSDKAQGLESFQPSVFICSTWVVFQSVPGHFQQWFPLFYAPSTTNAVGIFKLNIVSSRFCYATFTDHQFVSWWWVSNGSHHGDNSTY